MIPMVFFRVFPVNPVRVIGSSPSPVGLPGEGPRKVVFNHDT